MNRQFANPGGISLGCFLILSMFLINFWGCATAPVPPHPAAPAPPPKKAKIIPAPERERRTTDYVLVTATASDTYGSLAGAYLGDESLAYLISEYNRDAAIVAGKEVVVPLKSINPGGIYPDGYLTVPILVYHRLSPRRTSDKITVSEEMFNRQMAYLKKNGYRVLSMNQFMDFIEYRRRPPKKSVVITIDDGWKSARTVAMPILKKYGFAATLFLYTDLVSKKQNTLTLNWDDVRVMKNSGAFEFGSHTVSHSDLDKISEEQLQRELRESQRIISEKIGITCDVLAYPNGLFSGKVISAMKKYGYRAGFTVIKGGNPFFNNPYTLNRSMVYNSDKLDGFIKRLETYRRE